MRPRPAAPVHLKHLRQKLHAEALQPRKRHGAFPSQNAGHFRGISAVSRRENLIAEKILTVPNPLRCLPTGIHRIKVASGNQGVAAQKTGLFEYQHRSFFLNGCHSRTQSRGTAPDHQHIGSSSRTKFLRPHGRDAHCPGNARRQQIPAPHAALP